MNKTIIGALIGATVLATGCGTAAREAERLSEQSSPTLGSPTATTEPASPTGSPTGSPGTVSLEHLKQAAQAAIAAVPGSKLVAIESEENGRWWEAHVVGEDGTEHKMDIENGKVVRGPTTEEEDAAAKAKRKEELAAAKVDYVQAADKLVAAVPEGRIAELRLGTEHGKTVWEGELVTPDGTKHEATVDAATGEVVKGSPSPT
ncbi:hypothetical protein GCM10022224_021560 [Nonomuraea antimicrobica]|uniref:PepSY domain-containing protein n=1 Tax=Nonomuraea antimicrobica TaxID=561173 RepID=A0ABP7BGL0_9ACTN